MGWDYERLNMAAFIATIEELEKRAALLARTADTAERGDDFTINISTAGAHWMVVQLQRLVFLTKKLESMDALLKDPAK